MRFVINQLERCPFEVRKLVLKMLFRKNGLKLQNLFQISDKYYIYQVDNWHVPSESLSWYLSYQQQLKWVKQVSGLEYLPKSGDIIVDIGAGLGEECGVFSKLVGPTGKVYAMEANPVLFEILGKSAQLNNLRNLSLFQEALGMEDGTCSFSVASDNSIGGSLSYQEGNSYEVRSTRMDTFIRRENLDRIDLLKANIEGAERYIVETIGSEIKKVSNVAISCHDFRFIYDANEFYRTRKLVEDFLLDHNFRIAKDKGNRRYVDWVYGANETPDLCVE